jgi:hypothetical protein
MFEELAYMLLVSSANWINSTLHDAWIETNVDLLRKIIKLNEESGHIV